MTKIGKLWTGGVAYVSLLVGAGLSVAGNLADTYRTRADAVDTLDKVMAAGWPILVLLAIEMFVSPRWSTDKLFQVWRWLGCLAVGGMAMVVSWTHLHDLMSSRGQLYVVSVLGPLAIDGMAIMATGLILSTRVRAVSADIRERPEVSGVTRCPDCGRTDTCSHIVRDTLGHPDLVTRDMDTVRSFQLNLSGVSADTHGMDPSAMDRIAALPDVTGTLSGRVDMSADTTWHEDWDDVTVTRPAGDLDAWTSGYERALDTLSADIPAEAEAYLSAMSTDTTTLPQRTRTPSGSVPQEFVDMATAWDPARVSRADMVVMSAAHFGVSTRTVRRWLSAVLGAE